MTSAHQTLVSSALGGGLDLTFCIALLAAQLVLMVIMIALAVCQPLYLRWADIDLCGMPLDHDD